MDKSWLLLWMLYLHLKFWQVPSVVKVVMKIDQFKMMIKIVLEANIKDNKIPITSIKWNVGSLKINSQVSDLVTITIHTWLGSFHHWIINMQPKKWNSRNQSTNSQHWTCSSLMNVFSISKGLWYEYKQPNLGTLWTHQTHILWQESSSENRVILDKSSWLQHSHKQYISFLHKLN